MYKPYPFGNRTSTGDAMDDTTTIRIFDKLEIIGKHVEVMKDKMPSLATKDHVDLKIAEHAALPSRPPRANGNKAGGRLIGAVVAAIAALTTVVLALTQLL